MFRHVTSALLLSAVTLSPLALTGCQGLRDSLASAWSAGGTGPALSAREKQAKALESEGRLAEAFSLYGELSSEDPKNGFYPHRMAVISVKLDRVDDARVYFKRALDLKPEDAGLKTDLGVALYKQGTPKSLKAAEQAFREALAIEPDHARATKNLAVTLVDQGRPQESFEVFAAANPPSVAYAKVGQLLSGSGKHDAARDWFVKAKGAANDPALAAAIDQQIAALPATAAPETPAATPNKPGTDIRIVSNTQTEPAPATDGNPFASAATAKPPVFDVPAGSGDATFADYMAANTPQTQPAPSTTPEPTFAEAGFGQSQPSQEAMAFVSTEEDAAAAPTTSGHPLMSAAPAPSAPAVATSAPPVPEWMNQPIPGPVASAPPVTPEANPFANVPATAEATPQPTPTFTAPQTPAAPVVRHFPAAGSHAAPEPTVSVAVSAPPVQNPTPASQFGPERNAPADQVWAASSESTPVVEQTPTVQQFPADPAADAVVSSAPLTITPRPEVPAENPNRAFSNIQPASANVPIDDFSWQPIRRASRSVADSGWKKVCPVRLRDDREFAPGRPEFQAVYRGRRYLLSSPAAKTKFEKEPTRYVAAKNGADIVKLKDSGVVEDGTVDFARWYNNEIYFFTSAETMRTFANNPMKYAGR